MLFKKSGFLKFHENVKHFKYKYKTLYIESTGPDSVRAVTYTGDSYDISMSIESMKKHLGYHFFQCHESYIINTEYIIDVDRKDCIVSLLCGKECPVSPKRIRELYSFFRRQAQLRTDDYHNLMADTIFTEQQARLLTYRKQTEDESSLFN